MSPRILAPFPGRRTAWGARSIPDVIPKDVLAACAEAFRILCPAHPAEAVAADALEFITALYL